MKLIVSMLALCSLCFADIDYEAYMKEIHGNGNYTREQGESAERHVFQIEGEMQTLEGIAYHSNASIKAIIKIASRNLRRRGHFTTANGLERGWDRFDGTLIKLAQNQGDIANRNIGDFEPLVKWLSDAYEKIESKLGYQLCVALRLSDLKTINHGLVVVFRPCKYGYDEFYKHFATSDPKYRSLLPVVSYWTTVITCSIGTYGIGYFFICSPAGMLVEFVVDKKVAPWLAPKIYNSVCN
jgi:hypothetical protein